VRQAYFSRSTIATSKPMKMKNFKRKRLRAAGGAASACRYEFTDLDNMN
jgi:hypothetical protein